LIGSVYMYVVARDFGFAPNPFHGYCTLATCKPKIRKKAQIGDVVIGMGGARLGATGRIIFAMRVTSTVDFTRYWRSLEYSDKKPVRNGSRRALVGDNIYHRDSPSSAWRQADSHHSHADGTINRVNLLTDTSVDRVLISEDFFYFGRSAPMVPHAILAELEYVNGRHHRKYSAVRGQPLLRWISDTYGEHRNKVRSDPFDFELSELRFSGRGNALV